MTPGSPVLEVVDATVVKNGKRALDGLTLTIASGEHTAIVGANGAGKSTLIKLLTHEDRPMLTGDHDGGSPMVRVFGRDRWNVAELRSKLGVVSSDLHHKFVDGNSAGPIVAEDAVLSGFFAAYGFVRRSEATAAMRQQTGEALARMGVAHLARTPLNRMSTGEVRRVLIARALAGGPEALILDEPTAGLDVVARHRFLQTVRRLAHEGTTLVLVTHRVEEIVPEITRVVLLKRGRVAAAGPKAVTLTAEKVSDAFDTRIELAERDGFYTAAVASDDVPTR